MSQRSRHAGGTIQYIATVPASHVNQMSDTKCIWLMPILGPCVAQTPQAHQGGIQLTVVTARPAMPKPLWAARNVKRSSSTTQRMAPRIVKMARMTKANHHTRKGGIVLVALECLCKPDHLSQRNVSQ